MFVSLVSLAPTTHPVQRGFRDGKKDLKKKKNRDGVMEGQQNQALLISFLCCFLAFFLYSSLVQKNYVHS